MSETILEMTKDIVSALIKANRLNPDEVHAELRRIHSLMVSLCQAEAPTAAIATPETNQTVPDVDWKRSIQKHMISCLECGATFRQLSRRHLSTHDLDPRSYRQKYGIPLQQALSAREVTVRRRQSAKTIRPWEQVRTRRAAK